MGGTEVTGGTTFGTGGNNASSGGIVASGGSHGLVWSGGASILSDASGGTTAVTAGSTAGVTNTGGAPATGGSQAAGGPQGTGGTTFGVEGTGGTTFGVGGCVSSGGTTTGSGGTFVTAGANSSPASGGTSSGGTDTGSGGTLVTGGANSSPTSGGAGSGSTDTGSGGTLVTGGANSSPASGGASLGGGASPDASEPVRTFFVAPEAGDDDAAGTEENPFSTVERARDAIRLLGSERIGPVTVFLRGGRHVLTTPLELEAIDSGSVGSPISYEAYPGESPILSGGISITTWTVDAQGRWVATVPPGVRFRQLYVGGRRAQRARGQMPDLDGGWGSSDIWPNPSPAGYFTPNLELSGWRNPTDIEFGYYGIWNHHICPFASLDSYDNGEAQLLQVAMSQPCFFLGLHTEGSPIVSNPDYVENALELLDEPGEWYHDRVTNTLYYLPLQGQAPATTQAIIPLLERLLVVQGTLDTPVHDLKFRGITFAHATWLRPSTEGHVDVQANFTLDPDPAHDFWRGSIVTIHNQNLKSPAAVLVSTGQSISFERCTFTQLGSAGLDLANGARSNQVVGSRFFELSGNGIQVGDVLEQDHHPTDPRLIVKDNVIANNYLHDVGQDFTGSVGIFVGYTNGTVIEHNELENLPYTGVSLGWGWGEEDVGGNAAPQPFNYTTPTSAANNRVEFNHIHNVMQHRLDGGGIYTLGAQPNTVIRANYLHDIPKGSGIYLDQGSAYIEVTQNTVNRVLYLVNLNNFYRARDTTCPIHDNFFDQDSVPDGGQADLVANAGIQPEYQDILPGK